MTPDMKLKLLSLFVLMATAFGVKAQIPTIYSFSPNAGSVGTLVTIVGSDLLNTTSVSIGGASSVIISNSSDTLVAIVMPGAVAGSISIATLNGNITSANNFTVVQSQYPLYQQGNKLVGSGSNATFYPYIEGSSVAISADGNTAIIGIDQNDTSKGAVWIFYRNAGLWSQQGNKLIGSGGVFGSYGVLFGISVAISADGNTAIVGGSGDNNRTGAVWIFTRSGNNWTQQGNKLIGTGGVLHSQQGSSVALSADGNTAVVGADGDNNNDGALWVFVRINGVWTQQGNKLVATTTVKIGSYFGGSVAISADGNTIVAGGTGEKNGTGASWVFVRFNGVWTQQGNKLVGSGGSGILHQGGSVSISADGNSFIVGASGDWANSDSINQIGAAWIFVRNGNSWAQDGNKLIGLGSINGFGGVHFGSAVSISADGNTAIVGGRADNSGVGAIWVFKRIGGSWIQQGNKLVGNGYLTNNHQGTSAAISADGNTIIVGGGLDSNNISNNSYIPSWVFTSANYLPTTILYFALSKQENKSVITWQTSTEINTSHFNIQRSATGKDFTSIDKVNAKGASTYMFNDALSIDDSRFTKLYYRLEIVDKDGSKTYSEIRSVYLTTDDSGFTISPNPAKDYVTVTGSNIKQVKLLDNMGRVVVVKEVNNTPINIPVNRLSKGLYMVQAIYTDGSMKTEKVVVE